MRVGLGYHLVADDIKHSAAGQSQQHWHQRPGYRAERIAYYHAGDLNERHRQCCRRGSPSADAYHEQRRDHHQAFRNVLQGYTCRHGIGIGNVAALKHYARRHAFRQLVYGNGSDKEEYAID